MLLSGSRLRLRSGADAAPQSRRRALGVAHAPRAAAALLPAAGAHDRATGARSSSRTCTLARSSESPAEIDRAAELVADVPSGRSSAATSTRSSIPSKGSRRRSRASTRSSCAGSNAGRPNRAWPTERRSVDGALLSDHAPRRGGGRVKLEEIRAGMPVLEHTAYLNAGTFGPLPRKTAEAEVVWTPAGARRGPLRATPSSRRCSTCGCGSAPRWPS